MFSGIVVKLTGFCNLNCSYCYMFNLADKTYLRAPQYMSLATCRQLLGFLRPLLTAREAGAFNIILHGGEPTLWPVDHFEYLFRELQDIRSAGHKINVALQTNAITLRNDLLDLFSEHRVSLGVSIDGPPAHNDRYRIDHAGHGSYGRVMRTVERIVRDYPHLLGGFLSVIRTDVAPREYLDWVKTLPVPRIDVLWPIEYNYRQPPWGRGREEEYARQPQYGKWFADLFRLWWQEDNPDIFIRYFYDVVKFSLGGACHTDQLVNDTLDLMVVNTDGAIEYPDYFRSHVDGGSATRFNVGSNTIDDLIEDERFRFLKNLGAHLPDACRSCRHADICGGGFVPGRINEAGEWLKSRSVLCHDHLYFFDAVSRLMGRPMHETAAALHVQ